MVTIVTTVFFNLGRVTEDVSREPGTSPLIRKDIFVYEFGSFW